MKTITKTWKVQQPKTTWNAPSKPNVYDTILGTQPMAPVPSMAKKQHIIKKKPGTIQGSPTYRDNTPGIFVKSIKGMQGKKFVEKALDRTMTYYVADMN